MPKWSFPSFLFQSLQPVTGKMDLLRLLPGNWASCWAELIQRFWVDPFSTHYQPQGRKIRRQRSKEHSSSRHDVISLALAAGFNSIGKVGTSLFYSLWVLWFLLMSAFCLHLIVIKARNSCHERSRMHVCLIHLLNFKYVGFSFLSWCIFVQRISEKFWKRIVFLV